MTYCIVCLNMHGKKCCRMRKLMHFPRTVVRCSARAEEKELPNCFVSSLKASKGVSSVFILRCLFI